MIFNKTLIEQTSWLEKKHKLNIGHEQDTRASTKKNPELTRDFIFMLYSYFLTGIFSKISITNFQNF